MIGGFSILLQGVIGLVVTSFYHPFFLAFNACLIIALTTLWWAWAPGAVQTAIAKSHAKHAAAAWLQSIGASNGAYKSSHHLTYAIERSESVTAKYVSLHQDHFRFTFRQTVCLLLLYAVASAALLALGGWLIIINELSVGQLVAAELILSSVLYGVAQLGGYLENFYDLVAGLEELSLFWDLPQEAIAQATGNGPADGAFRLHKIAFEGRVFDFSVSAGDQLAVLSEPGTERSLAMLLRRLSVPEQGLITIGGADVAAFDMYQLRAAIMVLDGSSNVEMTAREYLALACAGSPEGIVEAVDLVGLSDRISTLPKGLDTVLSASGWPLSVEETMALKLAAALLAHPRVLILSSLYDLMPPACVDKVLARLKKVGTTVLQFTCRPEGIARDGWLWLGQRQQYRAGSLAELQRIKGKGPTDVISA
jgi:putative ABC transport system ATP-binding protein